MLLLKYLPLSFNSHIYLRISTNHRPDPMVPLQRQFAIGQSVDSFLSNQKSMVWYRQARILCFSLSALNTILWSFQRSYWYDLNPQQKRGDLRQKRFGLHSVNSHGNELQLELVVIPLSCMENTFVRMQNLNDSSLPFHAVKSRCLIRNM